MLLGFKRRFQKPIKTGEKTHTIRAESPRQWKPGVRCDCYIDPRQKTMQLIGRWPCTHVEQVHIEGGWEALSGDFFGDIKINGSSLHEDERQQLAKRDGFESFEEMMEFWRGRLPFEGIIIHWDYSKPIELEGRATGAQRWKR